MSVRPRPVTAKVRPPTISPSRLRKPRSNFSLGSSTESLVSILEHESCDSYIESEDEQRSPPKVPAQESTESVTQDSKTVDFTLTESTTEDVTKSEDPVNEAVSPWEKWLLQKTSELRIRQKEELRRSQQKKQQDNEARTKKQKLLEKAKENFEEWKEKKSREDSIRRRLALQKVATESELKEKKHEKLVQDCNTKYQEWIAKKSEEMKQQKLEEKERRKREECEKQQKRLQSDEAYERWRKEALRRPRSAPHSFGYCGGKLTGYHDRNAYPIPSFYNPIPWQPIKVPNENAAARKKKKLRKPPARFYKKY